MPDVVDLRSDTVTRPTDAMRRAMADAEVGDDVFGDDPTVNRLEERAAELLGHDAALYVPSGTMANQLALRVLARPGTEVVVDAGAHVVNDEAGAGAVLAGVQFRTIDAALGLLDPDDVAAAVNPGDYHMTPTSCVAVEQTHNRHGGTIYPLEQVEAVATVARRQNVNLYMDGARIFNAAVAAGEDAASYGRLVDGVMFCLSKGLGAPVGSVLVADAERIDEAREWRHRYGGAMRQAGVIAAAGLHALEHHVARLADDHANARLIAETVAEAVPDAVDLDAVQTNMVYLDTGEVDARKVVDECAADGVLFLAIAPDRIRLVAHLDVSTESARRAAEVVREALTRVDVPSCHRRRCERSTIRMR